jgi:hypothetical protein
LPPAAQIGNGAHPDVEINAYEAGADGGDDVPLVVEPNQQPLRKAAGFVKNQIKPNSFQGKIGPTADGNRPPGRLADLSAE